VSEQENNKQQQSASKKKSYKKPSFRQEKVFETMALRCGKTSPTDAGCTFNRRNS